MRRKACSNNWVEVGSALGGVWYRGRQRRFVAVRPDGSVLGADYRSRDAALLALAKDFKTRERASFGAQLIHLFATEPVGMRPAVGMEN